MSVWMLLVFALSMLAGVLSFGSMPWEHVAQPAFGLMLVIFLLSVVVRGIRKPVV